MVNFLFKMDEYNFDMMEDGEIQHHNEESDQLHEEDVSATVHSTFTQLDQEKLKKRAERFGIDPDSTNVKPMTKEQLLFLYQSLDLPAEDIKFILESDGLSNTHGLNQRFEAIHLRGTEDMSTRDVFDYFKGYAPASIEWINDYSCNVVWLEPWQAARAMLEKSSKVVKPYIKCKDVDEMEQETEVEEPPIPTPPGTWRLGNEYPKATALLMRFATRNDRKVKGAEKLSEYYKKYGNPNYGGMCGLISSSRKRRLRGKESPPPDVDAKNPWGSLAEAWGAIESEETWQQRLNAKRQFGSGLPSALVRRLGHQPPRPSPSRSRDTDSEDSDNWQTDDNSDSSASSTQGKSQKKRLRMRMYADDEEEKKSRRPNKSETLQRSTEIEDFGTKLANLRTSRSIHTRLGPNTDRSSKSKVNLPSRDLRERLGPAVTKTTINSMIVKVGDASLSPSRIQDSDDEIRNSLQVDLRSKLQRRLDTV